MKINEISAAKTFNIGNYESLKIGVTATVESADTVEYSFKKLNKILNETFVKLQNKDDEKVQTVASEHEQKIKIRSKKSKIWKLILNRVQNENLRFEQIKEKYDLTLAMSEELKEIINTKKINEII